MIPAISCYILIKSPCDCWITSSLDDITVSITLLSEELCLQLRDSLWFDDDVPDGDLPWNARLGDFSVQDGEFSDRYDEDLLVWQAEDLCPREDEFWAEAVAATRVGDLRKILSACST
jgi:hypothetical protein